MKLKLSIDHFRKVSLVLFSLLLIALYYSFFLITVVNILLLLLGILYQVRYSSVHKWKWLPIALLSLGFVPYLQGLLLSNSSAGAIREIQHNLAYLSIPLAFLLLPPLTNRQRNNLLGFFLLLTIISTMPVLVRYTLDFDQLTSSLGKGKAIPTPIDHVRYSIFIAIACVFSFVKGFRREALFKSTFRWTFYAIAAYLFLVVHVLAVRSGIILTYFGIVLVGSLLLIQAKKYRLLIGLVGIVILSPIVAYYTIPSFHKKVHYVKYDFDQQLAGKGANYSDSERMRSYKIGLELWRENPLLGVGTGDLQIAVKEKYSEEYPSGGRALLPHNQFLKFLSSSGVIGLLFFLGSFYIPFFLQGNYRRPLLLGLIGMLTVSFIVEATLERSYMLSLYLLLAALLYQDAHQEESSVGLISS